MVDIKIGRCIKCCLRIGDCLNYKILVYVIYQHFRPAQELAIKVDKLGKHFLQDVTTDVELANSDWWQEILN